MAVRVGMNGFVPVEALLSHGFSLRDAAGWSCDQGNGHSDPHEMRRCPVQKRSPARLGLRVLPIAGAKVTMVEDLEDLGRLSRGVFEMTGSW